MKFNNIVTEMLTLTESNRKEGERFAIEERIYSIGSKRRIVVKIREYHACAWAGESSASIHAEMFDPHNYLYWDGEEEHVCHSDWRMVFNENVSRVMHREIEGRIELALAQAYGVLVCTQY